MSEPRCFLCDLCVLCGKRRVVAAGRGLNRDGRLDGELARIGANDASASPPQQRRAGQAEQAQRGWLGHEPAVELHLGDARGRVTRRAAEAVVARDIEADVRRLGRRAEAVQRRVYRLDPRAFGLSGTGYF